MAKRDLLLFSNEFIHELGWFFGAWTSFEGVTDYALGKLLNVPHEDAHLITAGMMWGRKARLLADLLKRSDHPKKDELLRCLNIVRGQIKRDVFAHSYLYGTETTVTFLSRQEGSGFKAVEYTFTLPEFREHVKTFTQASADFQAALGVPSSELLAFAQAALSLNRKSSKSPG
jgi:hypothetical protein